MSESLIRNGTPFVDRMQGALLVPLGEAKKKGGFLIASKGGVYSHDGKLKQGACPARPDSMYFEDATIDTSDIYILETKKSAIYGGVIFDHYGHFLVETMARLWFIEQNSFIDSPIIFHAPPEYRLKAWQKDIFRLLGIEERVEICRVPVSVRFLIIPEAAFKYSQWSYDAFTRPFERIAQKTQPKISHEKLYISRSQLGASLSVPEWELEGLFKAEGFRILYPETLPFEEQARVFASHAMFCGISGSAMHNVLFAPRGSGVIYINRFKIVRPTFQIVDQLKGIDALYINGYQALAPEPVEPPDPVRLDLDEIYKVLKRDGVLTHSKHWMSDERRLFDDIYIAAAYLRRAEKCRWARHYDSAVSECDSGLALVKNNADLLIEKGNNIRFTHGIEEAIRIWKQALLAHPNDERVLQTLAEWDEGGFVDAAGTTYLDRLATIERTTDKSFFLIGRLLYERGHFGEAFLELARIKRADVRTSVLRGRCAVRLTKFEDAIEILKNALETEPSNSSVLHNLSTVYEQIGDLDSAFIYAEEAASNSPSDQSLQSRRDRLKEAIIPFA